MLTKEQAKGQLFEAVRKGDFDKVKLLINAEVDVNAQDVNGDTSIILAARAGNLKILQLLVENGADINSQDNKYLGTALHWAIKRRPVKYLDIMKYLISKDANLELCNEDGNTPIIFAAQEAELEAVKLLAENGADVNAQNKCLQTALHKAIEQWYCNYIVKYLVNVPNINLNLKDEENLTPLHLASSLYNSVDTEYSKDIKEYGTLTIEQGRLEIAESLILRTTIQNPNMLKPKFLNKNLSKHWYYCRYFGPHVYIIDNVLQAVVDNSTYYVKHILNKILQKENDVEKLREVHDILLGGVSEGQREMIQVLAEFSYYIECPSAKLEPHSNLSTTNVAVGQQIGK